MHPEKRQQLLEVLKQPVLPHGIEIREWRAEDFPAIQRLSEVEGWTSPSQRPADSLAAWQQSWPALIAITGDQVIGFVRGLTDGAITIYIAELLVDRRWRGQGIGRALLDTCHALYPTTRLDLLATDEAHAFYQALGFRILHTGMRKSYM